MSNQYERTIEALRSRNRALFKEREKRIKNISTLARTVGFFASVIKSGEGWSDACEKALQECMNNE